MAEGDQQVSVGLSEVLKVMVEDRQRLNREYVEVQAEKQSGTKSNWSDVPPGRGIEAFGVRAYS